VECGLNSDIAGFSDCCGRWRLATKTASSVFNLNNSRASEKLNIYFNGCQPCPEYILRSQWIELLCSFALCYSVAEYRGCVPAWGRSSNAKLVDRQLNETMRNISGTLHPTTLRWLPVRCPRCSSSHQTYWSNC